MATGNAQVTLGPHKAMELSNGTAICQYCQGPGPFFSPCPSNQTPNSKNDEATGSGKQANAALCIVNNYLAGTEKLLDMINSFGIDLHSIQSKLPMAISPLSITPLTASAKQTHEFPGLLEALNTKVRLSATPSINDKGLYEDMELEFSSSRVCLL